MFVHTQHCLLITLILIITLMIRITLLYQKPKGIAQLVVLVAKYLANLGSDEVKSPQYPWDYAWIDKFPGRIFRVDLPNLYFEWIIRSLLRSGSESHSAGVDPLQFVQQEHSILLNDHELLFPGLAAGAVDIGWMNRGYRREYTKLVVRQLRSGKIGIDEDCHASETVFTVGK